MPILSVVLVVLAVGVLMWVVNTWGGPYVHAPFLQLANVVAIIGTVIWLLHVSGVLKYLGDIKFGW